MRGLAIVDYRYPTSQPKPDGSCGSCTMLLWVTDDGGNHFSGPAVVGDSGVNGGAIAFGASDDPVIGTITDTVTGGTFFQPIHPGRYTSVKTMLGNAAPDEAYGGSLAFAYRRGTSVTVSFTRARGATTSAVKLHASDGTDRMVVVAKGKAVFRQVHRGTHLRATVRGVGISGRRGPSSVASKK